MVLTESITHLLWVQTKTSCCIQARQWSQKQLVTDLLRLHDPASLQPLFESQSAQPPLSLSELHDKCLAFFASWFDSLLEQYPVNSFIAANSRRNIDTQKCVDIPNDLLPSEQRQQRTSDIMASIGCKVHNADRQSPLTDCTALLAHGKSVHNDFARSAADHVASRKPRLLHIKQQQQAEDPWLSELLQDHVRTSAAEAQCMRNL